MNRREFSRVAGLGMFAVNTMPTVACSSFLKKSEGGMSNIPLGVGNHSLRGMRPNAIELIEFAIEHKLDSVQFNTLNPFESLDDKHLVSISNFAKANDISIYIGVGSISQKSIRFSNRFGDARTLLKEGIRIAKVLESPIIGVRIGILDDRYTDGGIKPKIEEVIKLMKSMSGEMLDSGIKFAFENHAGDMRSEELLELIDQTGNDICGAFFDPGNAIYAMEDPKIAMKTIGEHIICSQARDVVIWPTPDGATFQWTAIGEGVMDFKFYTDYLRENCPGVPIHIETISNSPRQIPYLQAEYWDGFQDLRASNIVDFLKLVREGHAIDVAKVPEGMEKKAFDIVNQKNELLKSINYLRRECRVGLKEYSL